MELQLGLALSSNPIKDLNLNKYVNDPKDENWTHSCYSGKNKAHKRSFDEAFEIVSPLAPTLPLLSWNDKPNNEDDDDGANRKSLEKSSYCTIHKSNGEGDEIMGWPPIPRCRRNLRLLHHHHQQQQQQQQQNQAGRAQNDRRDEMGCRGFNSMYVKVKMEGVAIGRKVDLSLHRSYQTLTSTLITMFAEYRGDVNGRRYTLTYQDRDGDWLLVGDIPWQTFIWSVQRIKIQRSGGSLARVFC